METIVQIFKALGDETRLKILIILSRRRICAKGIARHLNISEASVSQHLKVLKEAGIIVGQKIGYYVQYNLQESTLSEIVKFIDHINSDGVFNNCKFELTIPKDCKAACKSNKNKCCQKNKD